MDDAGNVKGYRMFKNPIVRRLIGSLVALTGMIACVASGIQAYRQASTSNWPSTEGRVVSSGVEPVSGRKGRTNYAPAVRYGYEVNGTKFEGERITISKQSFGSQSSAQAVADKYPQGSSVKVHYDAASPNSSVIQPGLSTQTLVQPALMLGLCVVGVVIVVTTKARPAGPTA